MLKTLATVLISVIRFHLMLYWIPLLTVVVMLGSMVWHSLHAAPAESVSSVHFVIVSWWNAGAMFVAPAVLRKNGGIKTVAYLMVLPFLVIPAYYKHKSEWFGTATDEMLALWRQHASYLTGMLCCAFVILPSLLFVVCSESSNGMIDEVVALRIIILSTFTVEPMFFIHIFVRWKVMQNGSWRIYLWLLSTYIFMTALVVLITLIVMCSVSTFTMITLDMVIHTILIFWRAMLTVFTHASAFLYVGYLVIRGFRYVRSKTI